MTGGFKNKYTLNQVILFLLYLESRYSYFYYILNHADSFFGKFCYKAHKICTIC